jgi:hypothetical protein
MVIYYRDNIEYFGEGGKVHSVIKCLLWLPPPLCTRSGKRVLSYCVPITYRSVGRLVHKYTSREGDGSEWVETICDDVGDRYPCWGVNKSHERALAIVRVLSRPSVDEYVGRGLRNTSLCFRSRNVLPPKTMSFQPRIAHDVRSSGIYFSVVAQWGKEKIECDY